MVDRPGRCRSNRARRAWLKNRVPRPRWSRSKQSPSKFSMFARTPLRSQTKVLVTTESPNAWGERQQQRPAMAASCPPKEQPPPETLRHQGPLRWKHSGEQVRLHLTEGATLSGNRTEGGNTFNSRGAARYACPYVCFRYPFLRPTHWSNQCGAQCDAGRDWRGVNRQADRCDRA